MGGGLEGISTPTESCNEVIVGQYADQVIFSLDVAHEDRALTAAERRLRTLLKNKILGIAAVDRIK
jgi:hypothetical protein